MASLDCDLDCDTQTLELLLDGGSLRVPRERVAPGGDLEKSLLGVMLEGDREATQLRVKLPLELARQLLEQRLVPQTKFSDKELRRAEQYLMMPLMRHQVQHVRDLAALLDGDGSALDVSVMGSGKTYTAAETARSTRRSLFVVCPKIAVDKWRSVARYIGARVAYVVPYSLLAGSSKGKFRHPWIKIAAPGQGLYFSEQPKKVFRATKAFKRELAKDLLVVFDECHYVKNRSSARHKAAQALSRACASSRRSGGRSAVLMLSSTPLDSRDHFYSLFLVSGLSRHRLFRVYSVHYGRYDTYAHADLVKYLQAKGDHDEAELVRQYSNKGTSHYNQCIPQTIMACVMPRISVAMRPPLVEVDEKMAFYRIPEADLTEVKKRMSILELVVSAPSVSAEELGMVTNALMELERIKLQVLERVTARFLQKNPRGAVVLGVSYKNNVELLRGMLEGSYGAGDVRLLVGKTTQKKRKEAISGFGKDYRILVANPRVSGVSIDLHDSVGDCPRLMMLVPSYYFADMIQMRGRVRRVGTASPPTTRVVFCSGGRQELSLLKKLHSKSRVLRAGTGGKNVALFDELEEALEPDPRFDPKGYSAFV